MKDKKRQPKRRDMMELQRQDEDRNGRVLHGKTFIKTRPSAPERTRRVGGANGDNGSGAATFHRPEATTRRKRAALALP
jgi:hypothetical protein